MGHLTVWGKIQVSLNLHTFMFFGCFDDPKCEVWYSIAKTNISFFKQIQNNIKSQ